MGLEDINYIISTEEIARSLLREYIDYFKNTRQIKIHCYADRSWRDLAEYPNVQIFHVPITRKVNIYNDLISLVKLIKSIYNCRGIFVYSTPKAAFLGALACFFTGKKNTTFIMRGRMYENYKGLKYLFYKILDIVICKLSKKILFISNQHKEIFINEYGITPDKCFIINKGSSKGVLLPQVTINREYKNLIKRQNGVDIETRVISFVGRICRDKGFYDFARVINQISRLNKPLKIIIAGVNEDQINIMNHFSSRIQPKITITGWCDDIKNIFVLSDLLVLPSIREGFGNVYIEASAYGCVPVGYYINGVRTAVINNKTGILVDLGDTQILKAETIKLLSDPKLLDRLMLNGVEYSKSFDRTSFMRKLNLLYEK